MTTTQFGVGGCITYFDFSDTSKITLSGSNISSIADSSDSGITADQATSGKRPLVVTDQLQGLQVADFDGGDQLTLSTAVGGWASGRTVFVVAKTDTYANGFMLGSENFSNGYGLRISNSGNMNSLECSAADLGSSNTVVGQTNYNVLCSRESGTSRNWRLNGTADGTSSSTSTFPAGWGQIGAGELSGTEFFNGQIACILVYNSALSDGDCALVEAGLQVKYFGGVATSITEFGTSLGASNAQTLPAGSVAGDLVVGFIVSDTGSGWSISGSNWTTVFDYRYSSAIFYAGVFARVLDGTGSDALTLNGPTQDYVATLVRIPAASHGCTNATIATAILYGVTEAGSGNADPPSLNAGSSKDWLWFGAGMTDATTGNTITVSPAGYMPIIRQVSANSTTSVMLGVASKRIAASTTENPGAFTNSSQEWVGYTVAVPPASTPSTVNATAAGTIGSITGAATATVRHNATATGTVGAFTGTATATVVHPASASGGLGAFTGTASATVTSGSGTVTATASGSLGAFTGTAAAGVTHLAAASGTITFTGSAAVVVTHAATAAGSIGAITGAAAARVTRYGVAAGVLGAFTGTALAVKTVRALATGVIGAFTGAAVVDEPTPVLSSAVARYRRPAAHQYQRPRPVAYRRPQPVEGTIR